ncbi:T-cell surface glycoprotein CD3 delta chain [Meriones unguiculatus]|uniref:T-cell surface glycoprotein CD3 delta chain n=1 Tax=Meriones unguiculatus TaxID=10047 RepID=UPI000B4FA69E|nr:T-cell surface glycoprotein CD3 delta chain [Meriones unguiculatus]
MEHIGLLAVLLLAVLPQGSPFKITVDEHEDQVFLTCNTSIVHLQGTVEEWFAKNKTLKLGKGILDPRGVYTCNGTDDMKNMVSTIQVYYRMCQNCVELKSATVAGIILADLTITLFLALGVYCFEGHETGRLSGAADFQALLKNEQLYQPLRDRDDAQYSRLGGNWSRHK